MGRKTKWDTHVLPRLHEIREWALTMNEEQMYTALGIGKTSWEKYKVEYPELAEALKGGRADLVKRLKSNLIKRADGYDYEEIKKTEQYVDLPDEVKEMLLDAGFAPEKVSEAKAVLVKVETSKKHERPDVAANNALLKYYDDTWHEADKSTMKLRERETEIKEKRADAETW